MTAAYSNEQKLQFVAKRAQGLSFDKIAQELGIAKNTLLQWQGELFDQKMETAYMPWCFNPQLIGDKTGD